MPLQERFFLLLADEIEQTRAARKILHSPLELANTVVELLFETRFDALKTSLDSIKTFAAGITRAEQMASYATARYYSVMFPFHQYFHSSYRARQGKVLEEIFKNVFREYTSFDQVPEDAKTRIALLAQVFGTDAIPSNDVDVMGVDGQHNRMILMQLRSRDDTGGTTAKGSLVDLLRGLLRLKKHPTSKILYLVGVWDVRDTQQRQSTIEKIYASLKDITPLKRAEFAKIGGGIVVAKNITLQMAYGTDEILASVFAWEKSSRNKNREAVNDLVRTVENWDDLWVAYALASLEIDTYALRNVSNAQILDQKMAQQEIALDLSNYANLCSSIDRATPLVVAQWTEDTLPVRSPSDQMLYVRDLLFLKAIYLKSHPDTDKKKERVYEISPHPKAAHEQLALWHTRTLQTQPPPTQRVQAPEPINFRALVPEISETTYLTHALYYYPAKFIPQVVRYCLNEYSRENSWVVDPFAGSGTVGLEALLCRRNAILLDLNPLLGHIVPLKMMTQRVDLSKMELTHQLDALRQSTLRFLPRWSNLAYWYPSEILDVLSRYWGWQKQMSKDIYAAIIEAALVKVSKQFSYAEHKAPKLFKSKTKLTEIGELLGTDWHTRLDTALYETAFDICARVQQLMTVLAPSTNKVIAHSGVDSTCFQFEVEDSLDCLISSPPYLQAQEYMRTAKLDLYWLGHTEEEIKRLTKLEIPYRKADKIVETPTLDAVRGRLTRSDLIGLLDAYFCYTLRALENAMNKLRHSGHACIFVGNPKIDGIEVETWRIITEYFSARGFAFEHVFEDRIKNRQLFGGRKNKNPDGMKSEFLLVLARR